jgi:hypothetical protein
VMNHWYMVLVMPFCGRSVICLCAAPDLSCQPTTLASVPGHHIFQLRGSGATELRHCNWTCRVGEALDSSRHGIAAKVTVNQVMSSCGACCCTAWQLHLQTVSLFV